MIISSASLIENILLFEATLALYAHFVHAAVSNISSCAGCTITAGPQTLSYPNRVSEVTSSATATVIPVLYQYPNGTEITSYSTVQGASASAFTNPSTPLTWTTLGQTLTYPTTYLAFLSPLAGVSKTFTGDNAFCYASLTAVALRPTDYSHLIFQSFPAPDPRHSSITSAVSAYLDSIPALTAAVAPYNPQTCSVFVGPAQTNGPVTQTLAGTSSVAVITHTSVALLVQTGRPVISKVGSAFQASPNPSPTPEPVISGPTQGTTTLVASHSTENSSPALSIGGSTITAGPGGAFAIGSQTLTPGGVAVVGGTTISLASGESFTVVGGTTFSAVTGGPVAVVGGTTVSLALGGSVAIVNGQTTSLASGASTRPVVNDASKVHWNKAILGVVGLIVCWV